MNKNKKKKQKRKPIPAAQYDKKEKWVQTHIEQFGEEPSFFWNIRQDSLVGSNSQEVD